MRDRQCKEKMNYKEEEREKIRRREGIEEIDSGIRRGVA